MDKIDVILKESPDPLKVRETTSRIFKNLKYIEINFENIEKVAKQVKDKIEQQQILNEEQFGSIAPTPQLIFILDAINFCFWAKEGEEKWTVEYPKDNFISNGWYGLVSAIERARKEGIPILNAEYLKSMNIEDAEYIFRSANSTSIPLLDERLKILNSIGKTLLGKYDGDIYNLLSKTDLDVGNIAKEIVKNFPSFEDLTYLDDKQIYFYKRAQIFAYDVTLLPELKGKNLESLTAFADYKIPQMLRAFKIIKYSKDLADKVDNFAILEYGSREEIEIRASTIWACEFIAHYAKVKPVLVDNVLWKMSQGLKDIKPYHRVLTTSY